MAKESEDSAVVDDLLRHVAVLEAAPLHTVQVERQHAVRQAHCQHNGHRS